MKDRPSSSFAEALTQARTLAASGRTEDAVHLLMTLSHDAPQDGSRLTDIGRELVDLGRYGKAHRLYMQVLDAEPERAETHLRAAELYLKTKDPELARVHLEHAKVQFGSSGHYHYLCGCALLDARDPLAAIPELFTALDAGTTTRHVYQLLSHALDITNRNEELSKIAAQGLALFPKDPTLTMLLARAQVRVGQDEHATALLKSLEPQNMEREVAATYWFDLGVLLDKTSTSEEAFSAFVRANDLKRPLFEAAGCSPEKSLNVIDSTLALDWSDIARKALPPIEDAPVFLIGFPRSGTTLLDQVLDAHPRLRVLEEKAFLLPGLDRLAQAGRHYPQLLAGEARDDFMGLRDDYLTHVRNALRLRAGEIAVDKLPLNLLYLPLIHVLFPTAKILLALRHPCDAVLSCFMQNFAENDQMSNFLDLGRATHFYARSFDLLAQCRRELPLTLHEVRYETLLDNLEEESRKIFSFLDLSWDAQVLNYREHALRRGFINTPSYHQVVRPLYTTSRNRWRRYRRHFEPHLSRLVPACQTYLYDL